MKSLEEIIMTMLEESGLDPKDEATQQLAGSLHNLFEFEWQRVEINSRIDEIEMALKQKNRKLVGENIMPDFANAGMIDPDIMKLRQQGLKKLLKQLRTKR